MAAYRLNQLKKAKGIYLTIEKKYWDKNIKQARAKHIESLGYLHELEEQYPDPIAHYQEMVQQMNKEEETSKKISLSIDMNEQMDEETNHVYNLGYAVIMKLYHELELDRFFNNKARHENFTYNTNSIMKLLVTTRILKPKSKKSSYEYKDHFFERHDFELAHIYRALSHYAKIGMECQQHVYQEIAEKYGRNTEIVYFDVSNFYFEIDKEDDLRRRGKSKEGRKDPIIQIGLAMDADGIPMHYQLFPGNTHDSQTFIPVIKEIYVKYNPGRIIAVADMGVISSDNIYFMKGGDRDKRVNGYVLSFSIRKATESFQDYVLNQTGYTDVNGLPLKEDATFKIKSQIDVREIQVRMKNGKKKKMLIDEKQIIFWNKNYADKSRAERAEIIQKAQAILNDPQKYTKSSASRADTYIKNITYDKNTGEIVEEPGNKLMLDLEKIEQDSLFDGYYCIVTSELDMSASKAIEIYRGLSEIEDTFKVSKSNLDLRPVYISRPERINAHVLVCFLSLVIIRLIQKKTSYQFTPDQIVNCLNRISCVLEDQNIYLFGYRTRISDEIGKVFNIDFTRKRLFLHEIKNILALAKTKQI